MGCMDTQKIQTIRDKNTKAKTETKTHTKKWALLGVLTVVFVAPLFYIHSRSADAEWVTGGTTYGPVIYAMGAQGTVGQNSTNVTVGTNTANSNVSAASCNAALFPSRCANIRGEAPASYSSGSGGSAWSGGPAWGGGSSAW